MTLTDEAITQGTGLRGRPSQYWTYLWFQAATWRFFFTAGHTLVASMCCEYEHDAFWLEILSSDGFGSYNQIMGYNRNDADYQPRPEWKRPRDPREAGGYKLR